MFISVPQGYFSVLNRFISVSQTWFFSVLFSRVYFRVSAIIISVSQPGLFLCLKHMVIYVSQPYLFQGYLCVSDRGISVSLIGVSLCLK